MNATTDHIAAKVARHLLEIEAVRLSPKEPFTWSSGMLSPIYCDNRIALSFPKVRDFLAQALVELSERFRPFDAIAGVATAGIPHGALLADRLKLPFLYVRSSAKEHGRRHLIEGQLPANARVLVVEDLISTGGSCLAAAEVLKQAGAEVAGVLAIFHYGFERADHAFSSKGIPFATLSNYDVLVDEAVQGGFIGPADLDDLRKWRADPDGWGALYAGI